jgi:hypothetical protein
MTDAVRKVIDAYKVGHQFRGYELHNDVVNIFPKAERMYPDTLLRMMRRYCHHQYKCLDHNKSLFERV